MSQPTGEKSRLSSWKEVADFFGATPRTVMRWEQERGLPVRRLPGGARSRVYADVADLRAWLAARPPTDDASPVATDTAAPRPSLRRRRWIGLALAAACALVLVAGASAWMALTRAAPPPLSPQARAAYDTANANFDRRTPASLAAALEGFSAVTRLAPRNAEGFAGLASTYAVMHEYTAMSAGEAFARAEEAARRGVALDDRNARAHAALAFSRFYGALDADGAGREFARAVSLGPNTAQIHHWYANYLAARRRPEAALTEIDRALSLDPTSPAIASDRALILNVTGRRAEAIAALQAVIASNPRFRSPHRYLADMAFDAGDDETFVRESRVASTLQADSIGLHLAEVAETGLRKGGRRAMLEALRNQRVAQFEAGVGGATDIGRLCALLGDYENARRYLRLGVERRETGALYSDLDPILRRIAAR